jgi:predicted ArsR family transcriptional regulator
VSLLRQGPQTVRALSKELGLTENAVRTHLADLDRDKIVHQGPDQKGHRKPFQTFEITEEAEHSFSRAYPGVLETLVSLLESKLPAQELNEILCQVGRNLAPRHSEVAHGSVDERAENAVSKLNALGGSGRVEKEGEDIVIKTNGCPLKGLTAAHPNACCIAASMLGELIGSEVRDECEHGPNPKCRFRVGMHVTHPQS